MRTCSCLSYTMWTTIHIHVRIHVYMYIHVYYWGNLYTAHLLGVKHMDAPPFIPSKKQQPRSRHCSAVEPSTIHWLPLGGSHLSAVDMTEIFIYLFNTCIIIMLPTYNVAGCNSRRSSITASGNYSRAGNVVMEGLRELQPTTL